MTLAEFWENLSDAGITASNQIQKNARKFSRYDRDDVLAAIGLESKRSAFDIVAPAAGFFAVGILAGVGLGLLFAPKSGYELREELEGQINKMGEKRTRGNSIGGDANPVL